MFLSDEGPMLETLDYTIRIGSTQTILYFDLHLYSAYAAHYVYWENSYVRKTEKNNNYFQLLGELKSWQELYPFLAAVAVVGSDATDINYMTYILRWIENSRIVTMCNRRTKCVEKTNK